MSSWSPTKIMSNLASSLSCSLRRMPSERTKETLMRSTLLYKDQEENVPFPISRSESPEIPMLDSPSVFRVLSNNDENSDPNSIAYKTRSHKGLFDSKNSKNNKPITIKGI